MTGRLKLRRGAQQAIQSYDLAEPDPRADDARQIGFDEQTARQAISDVFAGMPLLDSPEKVELLLRVRFEVRDHWTHARNSFLAIGRALLALDEDARFSETERSRLKHGTERLFSFSDAVASKLRQVARSVRDGRIPEAQCPSAYSTAYDLCVLRDDELEEAKARNIVRPDVPRSLVVQFRRELNARHLKATNRISLERLHSQMVALKRERSRLRRRLEQLELDLSEVTKWLSVAESKENS